ncbi:hypothetical protein L596_015352 [Steinernema carpocapsae]|uniref:Transmembrane protein n=1 Tax=Steinernema carpocapsae TaxID=34508 RepID=A0A4U5NEQ6_STECR|nr:hypothetical protein L596_015352 [Steinernema carpocapsae]
MSDSSLRASRSFVSLRSAKAVAMLRSEVGVLAIFFVVCLLSSSPANADVVQLLGDSVPSNFPKDVFLVLLPGEQILPIKQSSCADIKMEEKPTPKDAEKLPFTICKPKPASPKVIEGVFFVLGGLFYGIGVVLLFTGFWARKRLEILKEAKAKE